MTLDKFHYHSCRDRLLKDKHLTTNDGGSFLLSSKPFKSLVGSEKDMPLLLKAGMGYLKENDVYDLGYKYKKFVKKSTPQELNYFIIVPTLRCNLACSYCQVSRAHEGAQGFDWDEKEFELFLGK